MMHCIAVSIVRNCQDIIALSVLHHLLLGVDRCIVIDNGSTDGTTERLQALAAKIPRLELRSEPSEFRQPQQVGAVVNEHARRRRTLVIPFDADEFWHAPVRSVARTMAERNVNVLSCPLVSYVQRRSVAMPSRFSWTFAFRRVETSHAFDQSGLSERRFSFVELKYPRKMIWCGEGEVVLWRGAHRVDFPGARQAECDAFVGLHLPLRSKQELRKRAFELAPRMLATRSSVEESWQFAYFRGALARGEEAAQWRANSYGSDGTIDVFGEPRPTVVDFRLVRHMWRAYAYGIYLGVPLWVLPQAAPDAGGRR